MQTTFSPDQWLAEGLALYKKQQEEERPHIERLLGILKRVSELNPEATECADQWLAVGLMLHGLEVEYGLQAWSEWSQTGMAFDGQDCFKQWAKWSYAKHEKAKKSD
jgi:hypothetical protein